MRSIVTEGAFLRATTPVAPPPTKKPPGSHPSGFVV